MAGVQGMRYWSCSPRYLQADVERLVLSAKPASSRPALVAYGHAVAGSNPSSTVPAAKCASAAGK